MLEKVGSFTGLDDLNDGQRARLGQDLDNMSQSASEGINAIVEEYRKGINEEFSKFTEYGTLTAATGLTFQYIT